MTERVKEYREFLLDRSFRNTRRNDNPKPQKRENISNALKYAYDFEFTAQREEPIFYGEDLFGFNRCYRNLPYEEKNFTGNVTVDYAYLLQNGFGGLLQKVKKYDNGSDFYKSLEICINACIELAEKYRVSAKQQGLNNLAKALERVPTYGATSYYEALVMLKFISFVLRLAKIVHITFGRFDQYMKPYFDMSLSKGEKEGELLELTEMFFISLNLDTDIYEGLQQGDNGQSIVLGGCDRKGMDAFNELSEICLKAAEELDLIDPKINLRVNSKTPLSLYERGTLLTKMGMGFPQYSNDDIVIKGLTDIGYDLEDARDYTVAACWEFIVPSVGADIPNLHRINYPAIIDRATREYLETAETFENFLEYTDILIEAECQKIMEECDSKRIPSHPLLSAMISPCIERGKGLFDGGAKYYNIGVHGTGYSTAADTLSAIKQAVFEEKFCTPKELIEVLDADFKGFETLQKRLLACPKMGNNDDRADLLGKHIAETFSKSLNGKPNSLGGVYRAGTGSAMGYVFYANKVGATADGRNAKAPYASSYSPSLNAKINGPLSAIQSFTKLDLTKVCNGGPFTIEIHDTVFNHADGIRKTAQLVKTYIDLGGHQIQINSVNRDKLIEAQKHPENYPNLIVRVWGWSGYFSELDVEYQNHIIKRTEFTV